MGVTRLYEIDRARPLSHRQSAAGGAPPCRTAKSGADTRGYVGHFDFTGKFVDDTPGGIRLGHDKAALIDFRVPLSSSCTADPFTQDGGTCTPDDLNAPFLTFTTAGSPQKLFAQAATEGPNCVIFAKCKFRVKIKHGVATLIAKLRHKQGVGILVQRASGKKVGRVPLGKHGKGKLRLRWNLRVNGKKLHAGRYRITLRAVDKHKRVLGLTKTVKIRVR